MRYAFTVLCLALTVAVGAPGCTAEMEADSVAAGLSADEQAQYAAFKARVDAQGTRDQALIDRTINAVGGTVPFVGIVGLAGGAVWQGVRRDSAFRSWLKGRKPGGVA